MLTLPTAARVVNPAPSVLMSDRDFSTWCAAQCEPAPAVEPSDPYLVRECWWDGFTQGSDGLQLEVPADLVAPDLVASFKAGHWSGWDNWETEILAAADEPTAEDEAWWLGYQLGADGVDAVLATPDDAERSAFDRGHDSGDDHLWRVDPSFAAYLKERAERAAMDAAMSGGAGYRELVESGGDRARAVA